MTCPRSRPHRRLIPAGPPPPAANSDPAAPAWDLSHVYLGPEDPQIEADLDEADARAERFAGRWRGNVAPGSVSPAELAAALAEWEAIELLGRRPAFYASLRFAADTQDRRAQALLERTRERWTRIEARLVFFTVELSRLPDDSHARLAGAPELAAARHYLAHLRAQRPHILTEPEERVLTRKNVAGRDAFERLFEQLTGSFRFALVIDGATRTLTGEEMLALLSHPDPVLRERAYTTYLARFQEHGLVLTEVFNSLLLDHRIECELRAYDDLAAPTHIENEVTAPIVDGFMEATEGHYGLARRFFALKAKLLGLDRLKITDIYAPLGEDQRRISYAAAQQMVLDAFAGFSPTFHRLATEFFERRWIDAAVRPGKAGGASCMSYAPAPNPFIVASFTGTIRDVTTLAHELGHGIHDRLASRQRYLNYSPALILAETASVFAELLLTRHLLLRDTSRAERRAMLCLMLEEIIGTVFRQNVLTRFERAAHEARRTEPLTDARLGELWWHANAALYGEAVEMLPEYRWGWSYIPHFIHSRFYCYAYVLGELLALTLYQRYRDDGAAFLPHYTAVLAAGGSDAPVNLLARIGIDITDGSVWHRGFQVIEELIVELEALGTSGQD